MQMDSYDIQKKWENIHENFGLSKNLLSFIENVLNVFPSL